MHRSNNQYSSLLNDSKAESVVVMTVVHYSIQCVRMCVLRNVGVVLWQYCQWQWWPMKSIGNIIVMTSIYYKYSIFVLCVSIIIIIILTDRNTIDTMCVCWNAIYCVCVWWFSSVIISNDSIDNVSEKVIFYCQIWQSQADIDWLLLTILLIWC